MGSHESTVHGLLSPKLTGVPLQDPPWQASPLVQTLPSEQDEPSATGTWLTPALGLHASAVHGF
jgi:hypothetical protein